MRDFHRVVSQTTRHVHGKIEILNQERIVLDEIQGIITKGSYDITSKIGVRRTCQLDLSVDKTWLPKPNSKLWIDKLVRVYQGIKDNVTGDIVWFIIGTFAINNIDLDVSNDGNYVISFEGSDMVSLLNGDLGGGLPHKIILEPEQKISDAIKNILINEANETRLNIEDTEYDIPYKLDFDVDDTIWDIIEEIIELYMNFEAFYDAYGNFVFQKSSGLFNDSPVFEFKDSELITDMSVSYDYENVKNEIYVFGRINKTTNARPKYSITLTDKDYPNNPFTVEKLKEKSPRRLTIEEDKYYTTDQCQMRVDYEFSKRNHLAETMSINCLPVYFLDVNKIITVDDDRYGIKGKYCIEKISCGLSYEDQMDISCFQVYEPRWASENGSPDNPIINITDPNVSHDGNFDGVIDASDTIVGDVSPYGEKPYYFFPASITKEKPTAGKNDYWFAAMYKMDEEDIVFFNANEVTDYEAGKERLQPKLAWDMSKGEWAALNRPQYTHGSLISKHISGRRAYEVFDYRGGIIRKTVTQTTTDRRGRTFTETKEITVWGSIDRDITDPKQTRVIIRRNDVPRKPAVQHSEGLTFNVTQVNWWSVQVDDPNTDPHSPYDDRFQPMSFPPKTFNPDGTVKIVKHVDGITDALVNEYLLFSKEDQEDVMYAVQSYGFIINVDGTLATPTSNIVRRDFNGNWFTLPMGETEPKRQNYGVRLRHTEATTWVGRKSKIAIWNGFYQPETNLANIVQYKDLMNEGVVSFAQ